MGVKNQKRLAFYRGRDQQRQRCYDWERTQSWWCTATETASGIRYRHSTSFQTPYSKNSAPIMTMDECRAFVAMVYRKLGRVDPPRIKDGRGTTFARGGWRSINLPLWARTKPVILHELAHNLSARDYIDDGHGPWYMRYFIDLVARFLGADKSAMLKSAKAAGLKVAPASEAKISRRVRSGKTRQARRSSPATG